MMGRRCAVVPFILALAAGPADAACTKDYTGSYKISNGNVATLNQTGCAGNINGIRLNNPLDEAIEVDDNDQVLFQGRIGVVTGTQGLYVVAFNDGETWTQKVACTATSECEGQGKPGVGYSCRDNYCDANVCTCANGIKVADGSDMCTSNNLNKCVSCNDGYILSQTLCEKASCAIPNSNQMKGPDCACSEGFTGIINWTGASASGYCEADAAPVSTLVQQMCMIEPDDYSLNRVVKAECDKLPAWEASAAQYTGGGDCQVDDTTGTITCTKSAECTGGTTWRRDVRAIVRTMRYECARDCQGSLIISCCTICQNLQARAKEGDFPAADVVECVGCMNLEQQADSFGCVVLQGVFQCGSQNSCTIGAPQVKKTESIFDCSVIPCDSCGDNKQLQAGCCAECLKSKGCDEMAPLGRFHCQGCIAPPALLPEPDKGVANDCNTLRPLLWVFGMISCSFSFGP